MAHFEDLSEYTYSEPDIVSIDGGYIQYRPRYRRLNVGWLDAPHSFSTGPVPDDVAPKLLGLVAGPLVNVMRGVHFCTHCDDFGWDMLTVPYGAGTVSMGHAEIRVPGGDGVMYAAPTLIWHYVTEHGYRPPRPFIDALATYDPRWIDSGWIPADADREG